MRGEVQVAGPGAPGGGLGGSVAPAGRVLGKGGGAGGPGRCRGPEGGAGAPEVVADACAAFGGAVGAAREPTRQT